MNTLQAKLYFAADQTIAAADFLCNDGTNNRSVVRRGAALTAALPAPVTATTYGQLLDAIGAAGNAFAAEDVAGDAAIAAAEAARAGEGNGNG